MGASGDRARLVCREEHVCVYTVQHTQKWFSDETDMAAFQRYAPATPRHATPELVPSRVLEGGWLGTEELSKLAR